MLVVSGAYGGALWADALPAIAAGAASIRVANLFIFFFLSVTSSPCETWRVSANKVGKILTFVPARPPHRCVRFRIVKQAINFSAILPHTPHAHDHRAPNCRARDLLRCFCATTCP